MPSLWSKHLGKSRVIARYFVPINVMIIDGHVLKLGN